MTQARLYGFSDADHRRQATISVRDSIAEHLVDVEENDELFPRGVRGGIGFYRASSTGGYPLVDRPYKDVDKFIEHLGVSEFEIYRIAKFEQYKQINESEGWENTNKQDLIYNEISEDILREYVEYAMERANEVNISDDMMLLGSQVNGLRLQAVKEERVVSGVKSDFSGSRRIDGTWIVYNVESFFNERDAEEFSRSDGYVYDCTGPKPQYIDFSELNGRDGFVVEVGTKY